MTPQQLATLDIIVRHVSHWRGSIAAGVQVAHCGDGVFVINAIEFRKGAA